MSIYRESTGGFNDWRDINGGPSGLELVPGFDRGRVIRLLKSGVIGEWQGLARTNALLEALRDHLRATSGAGWATFPDLEELRHACRDLNTVGKMADSNGKVPPVVLMDTVERIRQVVYTEFINRP